MDQLIDKDSPAAPFAPAPAPEPLPAAAPLAPTFSGSGAEYFRIWVVNLLLSVATLGIYSAWAKTRRLQYFYRNTQLAGASFDFRGNPKAILRGRLLAVALLVAYQYAFGLSRTTGLAVVGLLLLGLPFGFDGGLAGAYAVYLPPVALVLLPGVLAALGVDPRLIGAFFLLYLCWPLLHGAMKRYQHSHLMVGDQKADFPLSFGRLALPYLHAFLLGLAAMVVFVAVVALTAGITGKRSAAGMVTMVVAIGLLYLSFLLLGPFVLVRMNNRAWSATAFPGVRIDSHMTVRGYLKLQVVNVLLTLLTLGLFRPFAAVRTWRYRIAHLHIDAPDGFEQATRNVQRRPDNAAGDGVADFLGVDLSW